MPAPIGYRRRILAVGLIAAGALYSFGAPWYVNNIEDDLDQRVPEELADAGFTGHHRHSSTARTARCNARSRSTTPRQATEAAYDVWGVHAITLDRSCRVNKAPQTGESRHEQCRRVVDREIHGRRRRASLRRPARAPSSTRRSAISIDADPRLSYLSMLLNEAGLSRRACACPGRSPSSRPTDEAFDALVGRHQRQAVVRSRRCSPTCSAITSPTACTSLSDLTADADRHGRRAHARRHARGRRPRSSTGVPIIDPDLRAGNGVVHVVNDLLEPGELDLAGTVAP